MNRARHPHAGAVLPGLLAIAATAASCRAATLRVGPTEPYHAPSAAAAAAHNGDTVLIDAGDYADAAHWTQDSLILRGVGGMAHVRDVTTGGKAIWVIGGRGTTVDHVEFSGASVPDHNGAGIRMEGTDLLITHSYFHDNEDGILAGDNAASTIVIEFSRFDHNGYGDGYSHNMYINHVGTFILHGCDVRRAVVGHNVKSRAYRTFILTNRILDVDGSTSRSIDLPNGGAAVVTGNLIEQGPDGQNSNIIGYGLEGLSNPRKALWVINNTIVNDRGGGSYLDLQSGTDTAIVANNIFAGPGTVLTRAAAMLDSVTNLAPPTVAAARLANSAACDYHLAAGSPAIGAGTASGAGFGTDDLPREEFVAPDTTRPRAVATPIDIGAYAHAGGSRVGEPTDEPGTDALTVFPQPVRSLATFRVAANATARIEVVNACGRSIAVPMQRSGEIATLDCRRLPAGVYVARVFDGTRAVAARLLVVR